jgi:peptide/nickel transport system permease protein
MSATSVTSAPEDIIVSKKLGFGFWLCVTWVGLMAFIAIFASALPLKSPTANFLDSARGRPPYAPSWSHWFGTDKDARDVFSRSMYGYYKGWIDRISSFGFIVLLSFPSLVLAILLTSLIDRNLLTVSMVLGLLSIAPVGRLARAATLQYADREFVLAARQIGATNRRIIIKEILPNVAIPMSSLALLGMAVAVVAEGGLAFLGFSVQKGITWGGLIQLGSDASRTLQNAPWIAFFPILMLFLTVLSLNFAGDRLRTYFDVKETTL